MRALLIGLLTGCGHDITLRPFDTALIVDPQFCPEVFEVADLESGEWFGMRQACHNPDALPAFAPWNGRNTIEGDVIVSWWCPEGGLGDHAVAGRVTGEHAMFRYEPVDVVCATGEVFRIGHLVSIDCDGTEYGPARARALAEAANDCATYDLTATPYFTVQWGFSWTVPDWIDAQQ